MLMHMLVPLNASASFRTNVLQAWIRSPPFDHQCKTLFYSFTANMVSANTM